MFNKRWSFKGRRGSSFAQPETHASQSELRIMVKLLVVCFVLGYFVRLDQKAHETTPSIESAYISALPEDRLKRLEEQVSEIDDAVRYLADSDRLRGPKRR